MSTFLIVVIVVFGAVVAVGLIEVLIMYLVAVARVGWRGEKVDAEMKRLRAVMERGRERDSFMDSNPLAAMWMYALIAVAVFFVLILISPIIPITDWLGITGR
jgi:hypothetical protein